MYGFYPIVSTVFTGAEVSLALSDTTVPITTVTVDSDAPIKQYMASVWPLGIADNYKPWASANLIAPDQGYYRWFSLPTQSWFLHFGLGTLLTGLTVGMDQTVTVPGAPTPPAVNTPQAKVFQGSVDYAMFTGGCSFFDFNWVTTFTSTDEQTPLYITVTSNPAHLRATVIGRPSATVNGPLYDTIRIIRMDETIAPGLYPFTFSIANTNGLSSTVTLNLTVV